VRLGSRRVRVRQSALDAFLKDADEAGAQATTTYTIGISDHVPSGSVLSEDESAQVWTYEVEAPSADRAVAIAIARWRKELGSKIVAQSINATPVVQRSST
jgi:hypothetical protein